MDTENKHSKILIIEDDRDIRETVSQLLSKTGCLVYSAANGDEGLSRFTPDTDLIILDIMMPGMSGFEVCRRIRERSFVPILFLSARGGIEDIVEGLASGGDDYMVKPFSPEELSARVLAMLRRNRAYNQKPESSLPDLHIGDLCLSQSSRKLTRNGVEIDLTFKEYQIMLMLLKNRGQIFSIRQIYEDVWMEPFLRSSANTVMVHVRKLRSKIEDDPQNPKILLTAWGRGYYISV